MPDTGRTIIIEAVKAGKPQRKARRPLKFAVTDDSVNRITGNGENLRAGCIILIFHIIPVAAASTIQGRALSKLLFCDIEYSFNTSKIAPYR